MTPSVIMLLTGPLQSWGGPAAGVYERPTDTMPSLSAVVGIIANAFGRARTDPINDIAAGARLAVRADRPGIIIEDLPHRWNARQIRANRGIRQTTDERRSSPSAATCPTQRSWRSTHRRPLERPPRRSSMR